MQVRATDHPEVLVIEPTVHRDACGFFLENYDWDAYRAAGLELPFVQDNFTQSVQGTLRGLHLQRRQLQGKLVRVVRGEIYDVCVDVRRGSPFFGRSVGVTLSGDNFRQVYVPPGFAHGFCTLSDIAQVAYKCTAAYAAADEIGIIWNDPTLAIEWPLERPILSDRDRSQPPLADVLPVLPQAPYTIQTGLVRTFGSNRSES